MRNRICLVVLLGTLFSTTALAQQSLQGGDTVAALDALNKAAAIAPNDRQVNGMLARLKGQRPNPTP